MSSPYCQICESAILRAGDNFKVRMPARAIDLIGGVLVCNDHRDEQIVRCAGNPVLAEVLGERRAQVEQWGGAEHDDVNELEDWLRTLRHQFDRATQAVGMDAPSEYRGRLTKIAAVAIAAIESLDRKRARV